MVLQRANIPTCHACTDPAAASSSPSGQPPRTETCAQSAVPTSDTGAADGPRAETAASQTTTAPATASAATLPTHLRETDKWRFGDAEAFASGSSTAALTELVKKDDASGPIELKPQSVVIAREHGAGTAAERIVCAGILVHDYRDSRRRKILILGCADPLKSGATLKEYEASDATLAPQQLPASERTADAAMTQALKNLQSEWTRGFLQRQSRRAELKQQKPEQQ